MIEERKQKEIEHSRKRREVLQGFERLADTHAAQQVDDLDNLITDQEKFDYHFSNMKYYSITGLSEKYKHDWLKKKCKKNKTIIDFASGNGENGIFAAQCGAKCIGIDISPEGIENADKNAEKLKVADHCEFFEMDGENMTFEDNTFDLGVEYGALHHVDLEKTLSELARVLKKDGEMICVEALRHNPLIHSYRKRTPHLRTEWEVEHILGVESLQIIKKYFERVEVKFFHLSVLALVPLRKTFLFRPLLPIFNFVDKILLCNQMIGKYGWIMVVELAGEKK
jgi:ubiquinone/menaquinone biosynthesis C-methylase UbiE